MTRKPPAFLILLFLITIGVMIIAAGKIPDKITLHKSVKSVDNEEIGIKWMSIEQAQDSIKIKPRKILVKLYTDWCGICKMMDRKTFSKQRITKLVGQHYYAVKLNAEQTASMRFNDSTFTYNPTLGRGIHNLAVHLGKEAGTVSYPTLVVLNEKLEVTYRYVGYMNVINLEEVLDVYR